MKIRLRNLSIPWACGLSIISLSPPSIAAAVLSVFALNAMRSRESRGCARVYVTPLLFILIIGAISVLLDPLRFPAAYLYFKDGFYFLLPILALCAGIGITRNELRLLYLLQGVIISCVVITVVYYFDYAFAIGYGSIVSLDARYEYGLDSNAAVIAFVILFTLRRGAQVVFSRQADTALLWVFVLAIGVSLSRTNILISLVAIFFPLINRPVGSKALIIAAFFGFLFIAFGAAVFEVTSSGSAPTNFVQKIVGSVSEVVVRDMHSLKEINNHWRSYEGFLGLEVFRAGDWLNYVFGQGFGSHASAADIYQGKFEVIPIFHFGYITILLKSGWLGLVLYFFFFYNVLSRVGGSGAVHRVGPKDMLIKLLCVSLILKTYFVMGVYTPKSQVLELVVLGALLRDFHSRSVGVFGFSPARRRLGERNG